MESASLKTGNPVRQASSSDSTPLASVIVLNYNGEKIIRRCLNALMRQTYTNFEVIVVDNNSSDASLSILEEYLESGNLTIVRSHKNLGVPGGRNLGVRHARGAILAFIDNDGYADSHWLSEGISTLLSDLK